MNEQDEPRETRTAYPASMFHWIAQQESGMIWARLLVVLLTSNLVLFAITNWPGTGNLSSANSLALNLASQRADLIELAARQGGEIKDLTKHISALRSSLDEVAAKARKFNADNENIIKVVSKQVLTDPKLRADIARSVSDFPKDGFVEMSKFKEHQKSVSETTEQLSKSLEKLLPVYDALDMKNKENTLAIPLMRKDISALASDIARCRKENETDTLAIQAEILVETSRIYDLGKWFFGLLIVACILPLIEPLFKFKRKDI